MPEDPEKLLLTQPTEADLRLFQFYKKNPDIACIDLLKQDLAPFQRTVINGVQTHSYTMSVLARGSGKTRMIAMTAAIMCMFNHKMRVGLLAPGFRQAKLAFNELLAIMDESEHLQASIKRISKQTDIWSCEFHNGSVIFALPLAAESASSIRGTRVHAALIDEYPHVPKEVIDLVINPMLATQRNPMMNVRRIEKEKKLIEEGKLLVETKSERNKICGFSSAYFQFNHMYKTICDYKELGKIQKKKVGKSDYAVYVFNYKDAPEGFFDLEMIEHAKKTSSDIAFRMEYMSEFPADSEGFFKRSLIDSCVSRPPDEFKLEMQGEKGAKYILGVDPARNNDNFAISIIKLAGQEMRLVRVITYKDTAFPIVAQKIRELLRLYNIELIGVDAGGGGLAIKDLLADPMTANGLDEILLDIDDETSIGKKGSRKLRMVNFSSQWIGEANYNLRSSFEHRKLLLPAIRESLTFIKPEQDVLDLEDQSIVDYLATINELQSIVMTATKTGVLHFDTPNPHMKKDRYSALLVGHKIAYDYLVGNFQPKELATGGFIDNHGNLLTGEEDQEIIWTTTRILDDLARARESQRSIGDGALGTD